MLNLELILLLGQIWSLALSRKLEIWNLMVGKELNLKLLSLPLSIKTLGTEKLSSRLIKAIGLTM